MGKLLINSTSFLLINSSNSLLISQEITGTTRQFDAYIPKKSNASYIEY